MFNVLDTVVLTRDVAEAGLRRGDLGAIVEVHGSNAFEVEFGIRVTRVGVVEEGEGVFWLMADGARELVRRGGYQHFGGVS